MPPKWVAPVARAVLLAIAIGACASDGGTTAKEPTWSERDIDFPFGSETLHGVLTTPSGAGSHPAVVLVAGSADGSGIRANTSTRWFIDHARELAHEGFAVLRYDPPGVGGSTGAIGLLSLDARAEEAAAALRAAGAQPEVDAERVGLLGVSQGGWVISMTADRYPGDVAFLISVVGSGQSVAQQQIYGIRAQSQAAGLSEEDVLKAVVFGRLLVDWQLTDPVFREANASDLDRLDPGPWDEMAALVYDVDQVNPVERFERGVAVLRSIQDESWAAHLYVKELYLPRLEAVPPDVTPELMTAIQLQSAENLLMDPREFWTSIEVPVLAIFGENDLNVDSEISAARYEQFLTEAGNDDFTIEILPGVGHGIVLANARYRDTLIGWLTDRFG